jgi:hypothetical protein
LAPVSVKSRPRAQGTIDGATPTLTGYPVAVIHKDTPENREMAMTLTAERVVEEKTLRFGEGIVLTPPVIIEIVRDFRHVIGDYAAA